MSGLRSWATDVAYSTGWRLVRSLPEAAARSLFSRGAERAYRRNGPSVRRLRENLARVLGSEASPERLEEVVRAGVHSYTRYWLEAFRLPNWSHDRIKNRIEIQNLDVLTKAYAEGNGVIGALHHSGNWDHAGAWASVVNLPVTSVAERLKPEKLYRRFLAYREKLGMEIIPTTGGNQSPLDVLTDRLTAGRIVVLLADRDLSRRGIEVDFFGGRTRMPAGPALLALQTGAPLLVISLWYDGKILRGRIHDPIPLPSTGDTLGKVAGITQQMADLFAADIAEHPQDWHMMQRLWIDQTRPVTTDVSG